MALISIGLDIGNSEIKFAVRKGKTWQVAATTLPEELVSNGHIQISPATKRFLKAEKRRLRIPGGDCTLVLPEQQVFCRPTTMPYIPENQLVLNLPYEFRDYIPQNSDKYYYDYAVERIVPDDTGKPASIELMAAAILKETAKSYSDLLSGTGFRLKTAVPREMAFVYLLRAYEEANPGEGRVYCFTDIGQESTRVCFFESSHLSASRTIPIGCRDLDLAIADEKNVNEHIAASYKRTNFEGALDSPGCRDVYSRLAIEVMKAVNFFRFRNTESRLSDLYFLGGGAGIRQLRDQIIGAVGLTEHDITELLPEGTEVTEDTPSAALACGATLAGGGTQA
jgi:type IV pilus assembly protein PilM